MKDKPLPNGCGIAAVADSWMRLRESGAPSRIMAIVYRDGDMHAATAFEAPNGKFFVYDERGSRRLHGASMSWTPLRIARRAFGSQIVSAKWINPETAPEIPIGRRLSPRECRGRSLFTV